MIVGAEDMDDVDGILRGSRSAAMPVLDPRSGECEGERERGAETAVKAGEDRADSKVSKSEEEGVW